MDNTLADQQERLSIKIVIKMRRGGMSIYKIYQQIKTRDEYGARGE